MNIPNENNLILVSKNGKCGYKDISGNIVCPIIYDHIWKLNVDGYHLVSIDNNCGYLDINGKIVIECKYNIEELLLKYELFICKQKRKQKIVLIL